MTTANTPVLHPDLTPAQRDCLDALPLTGNHVVSGPPGSGKSLLAAHRAVHFALTGRPTLLLSRSNLLRQLLRDTLAGLAVPGTPVEASTTHLWVYSRFGRDAPRTEDGWFDWTALVHRAAAFGNNDPATPHLVVDEGQDLPPGLYQLARLAAASVTVFADECQRLTETNSTLTEITDALGRSTARVEIAGNHRNSREIASLAEHFRTGGARPEIPFRSGTLPVVRHYSGPKDLADDIAALAARHPRDRIGVIVNSSRTAADLMRRLERVGLAHEPQLYSSEASSGRYRDLDLARPGVVLVHRASVKGLDFDTVVIADAESDSATDPTAATLRMAYYVMITRARERLVLGWQGSRLPRHLEGLHGWVHVR
ncbi:AAA family ATPase [Streptomyces europaeiscabiei]|uniref:AAA family ATPase n=1 Tax=Streptomyces europaeiscabiei TaxID=146819 RepID=A0ABU4NC80_9ACTN|nr:AAA family ATPase [Streptomyces europaeiscabiei]MDX3542479.1 AAA family ATPase [Streptomyces europaeiscabiei]MDX3550345.1 AAA family ATPase [Streptomyces europaeiscabiei]MDX3699095.1 AAA family ATPase [Streptomyces europaeiscabiei]MDX3832441.1 AAA family ATPase [Streptomyces europaeiscabiei]MDX3841874.1 AAA family ATPase [Streptomyces europaeiscabiei]